MFRRTLWSCKYNTIKPQFLFWRVCSTTSVLQGWKPGPWKEDSDEFQNIFFEKDCLCTSLVHRWVGLFQKCNLTSTFMFLLLRQNFEKNWWVLSEKSFADALANKFVVNEANVRWLFKVFLMKFTKLNLNLFILYCVCWRVSGRHCNNFKNFLRKLWLWIVTLPGV